MIINKKSKDRVGEECIYIKNPEFNNFEQEFDHIAVSDYAIFLIETKNIGGRFTINKEGDWIREWNDGKYETVSNCKQQIQQHHKLMESILNGKMPIVSILCNANNKTIINNKENFKFPILRVDELEEYINGYKDNQLITNEIKEWCIEMIYKHMVHTQN